MTEPTNTASTERGGAACSGVPFALSVIPLALIGGAIGFFGSLGLSALVTGRWEAASGLLSIAGALFGGFVTCALDLALDALERRMAK